MRTMESEIRSRTAQPGFSGPGHGSGSTGDLLCQPCYGMVLTHSHIGNEAERSHFCAGQTSKQLPAASLFLNAHGTQQTCNYPQHAPCTQHMSSTALVTKAFGPYMSMPYQQRHHVIHHTVIYDRA